MQQRQLTMPSADLMRVIRVSTEEALVRMDQTEQSITELQQVNKDINMQLTVVTADRDSQFQMRQ